MSALASTSTSTPMMDDLPKRKRKRTRSRKSKGGPTEEDGDDDEVDSGVQPEEKDGAKSAVKEDVKPSATKQSQSNEESKPQSSSSDAKADDNDNDSADEGEGEGEGKKKRKRKRNRSKKGGEDSTQSGASTSTNASTSAVASTASASLSQELKTVPNPESDDSLPSESAKKAALTYACIHHTSRSSWKFQTAKQAWLQRHLLTCPLPTEVRIESEGRTDTISGDPSAEDVQPVVDNSIPDTYLPLVVNYLGTMQGKSKERLLNELRGVVASMKALPTEEEQLQANVTQVEPTTTSTGSKTVSFADVADEQNRRDEGLETLSEEKRKRDEIRWKGNRAERVLQWLA